MLFFPPQVFFFMAVFFDEDTHLIGTIFCESMFYFCSNLT